MIMYTVVSISPNGTVFAPRVFDSLDRASSWIFMDDPDATMDLAQSKYPYYRYVGNFTYHVHAREVNAC